MEKSESAKEGSTVLILHEKVRLPNMEKLV